MNHIASFFLLNRVSCRDMSRSFATVVRLSIMEAAASINLINVLMSLSVNVFIIQPEINGVVHDNGY